MASADWMKSTTQKAGAMKKHLGQKERQNGTHSNKEIDNSRTQLNYCIGCKDYQQAYQAMKNRTAEVDKIQPPKRLRKDRVTCCFIEIPCPQEIQKAGKSDEFFQKAYEEMLKYFGDDNVHGGFVHKDEVHEYTDKDGTKKMSLEHMHTLVSAYTKEKGINGKAFETRARLKEFNKALDNMCLKEFGVQFNTRETPQRKSVETLKLESKAKAELDELQREKKNLVDLLSEPPLPKKRFEKARNYQERLEVTKKANATSKLYKEIEEKQKNLDNREQKLNAKEQELYERERTIRDEKNKSFNNGKKEGEEIGRKNQLQVDEQRIRQLQNDLKMEQDKSRRYREVVKECYSADLDNLVQKSDERQVQKQQAEKKKLRHRHGYER